MWLKSVERIQCSFTASTSTYTAYQTVAEHFTISTETHLRKRGTGAVRWTPVSLKENLQRFLSEMSKHFPMTLDEEANSFLGMDLKHNSDGSVELSQPKLINKLLKEFPARTGKRKAAATHPYGPVGRDLLGQGQTSWLQPRLQGRNRITRQLQITTTCEVDASYLTHADSKGHTGYCMGFGWGQGVFFSKSQKQTVVPTSSTHAEMRAIYSLTKDILFVIQLCVDMEIDLKMPAIILEDNSAVITMATEEASYLACAGRLPSIWTGRCHAYDGKVP